MKMKLCESCKIEHDSSYASGRFCSAKCSRSFSTRNKRKEINEKVSKTLNEHFSHIVKKIEKNCVICSNSFIVSEGTLQANKRACSKKCASILANSSIERRDRLSKQRIQAIIDGKTNFNSIKCVYNFKGNDIRCDSKIEYACLNYFETIFNAISMKRCEEIIVFNDNGQTRRFNPDFIIETSDCEYIVECKSFVSSKALNEKWRKYNELSIKKKELLIEYAYETNRKSFWFTKDLHLKYYNNINFKPL